MRIYSNPGGSNTVFEFTERIFENKVNKFNQYGRKFLSKYFKRKNKVSAVYFTYTFGYKTKDPAIKHYCRIYPPLEKLTLQNIIDFAIRDMQLNFEVISNKYDEILENSKLYYLREIVINFLYT